jgi:uncharacterized membrane protein
MDPLTWADEKVEQIVGILLQVGVFVSGAVVFAGGILYLMKFGRSTASYHTFTGETAQLRNISSVLSGASRLDGPSVIQLGLLLLIATPVVRVIFSLVAFWLEGDKIYLIFTTIVLAILLFSLLGGTL